MANKKQATSFYDLLGDKYEDYFVSVEKGNSGIYNKRIPTGSLSLDASIGGGIPMRKFTEIYGPEGVGKSVLAQTIAKNAIELGYNVMYVDPEQAVSLDFARKLIGDVVLDNKKFTLIQPEFMESALDLCEKGIRENLYNLVILDSVASMVPKKVLDETLEDSNPYILPKKLTVFVNRNAYEIRKRDVAFIGINQVRDDTSNPYIRTFSVPGGHAWKHILSLQIQLTRSSYIQQGDDKIGINSKFLVKKSKVSAPFRSFEFPIMFGDGFAYIDHYRDVIQFAESIGVVSKAGAYYRFGETNLGRGISDACEYLKNEPETLDKIKNVCYNAISNCEEELSTDLQVFGVED